MNYLPIFIDTNLLSIFSEINRLDLMVNLLEKHKLYVSPAIQDELSVGVKYGQSHLQGVLNLIGKNQLIGIETPSSKEAKNLSLLPSWMALGEAECIVMCQARGWVFASL